MEHILFFIMLFLFYGYCAAIWIPYGVQSSISQSWYALPVKLQFIFTLVTWAYGILGFLIFPSTLSFLALSGLGFVGYTPNFRGSKYESLVHVTGATLSMIFSQAVIIFMLELPLISYITLVILLALEYMQDLFSELKKNKTWWLEVIVFTSVAVAYAVKLF